ncbi:RDD family protein [Nesterenkonia halophila]
MADRSFADSSAEPPAAATWPGKDLGLPEAGPGSMAGMGRRLVALLIDWLVAGLISAAWLGGDSLLTLLIFAGMHTILLGLLGTTLGKRVVRLQVVRGPRPAGVPRALLRTVLLLLILPAVLTDGEGRPLHDAAAGTVQLRM